MLSERYLSVRSERLLSDASSDKENKVTDRFKTPERSTAVLVYSSLSREVLNVLVSVQPPSREPLLKTEWDVFPGAEVSWQKCPGVVVFFVPL